MKYSIKDVFQPKLIQSLRHYSRAQFGQDALAGVIVGIVDSTAMHNLGMLIQRSHHEGITIILSGVKTHVLHQLQTGGIEQMMNPENICPNIHVALKRANALLNEMDMDGTDK